MAANLLPTGKERNSVKAELHRHHPFRDQSVNTQCRPEPRAVKLLSPFCFFHCSSCLPLNHNGTTLHPITWMNTSGSCLREQKINLIPYSICVFRFLSCSMLSQASWKGFHVQFILAVRPLDVLGKGNPKAHWNTFAVLFSTPDSGLCTNFSCPHLLQV